MTSFIARLMHYVYLVRRSHTLGVRALVYDPAGRVFLVRHSYVSGWYLPGGGVERGETLSEALAKELREEGNIHLTAPAQLVAVYLNRRTLASDHVALYFCPAWRQPAPPLLPNYEIVEAGFFALTALPEGVSEATRRRLNEFASAGPYDPYW